MTFDTIADIENSLCYLSKSALEQVARYVGVSRFYAMNMEQLRGAILAIAQGEVAPLPIYKRNIWQPKPNRNGDIVDAVLAFSKANLKQFCIEKPVPDEKEMTNNSLFKEKNIISYHSIADIEESLSSLKKFPLEIISRNVGVNRFSTMNMSELRAAILAIAKGEVAPLPIEKRHLVNALTLRNQAIIDAVLELNQANSQK